MNILRTKKDTYQSCNEKNYYDLEKFFTKGKLYFDKNSENAETLIKNMKEDSRVWLLFASNNNKDWDCVQVAHSKYKVLEEIRDVLKYYKKDFNSYKKVIYKNSAFFESVCPNINNVNYREALYSKIGSEYSYFIIRFLDVDKYLGIENIDINANDVNRIIEICKNQYAEAKIAYQTLAVYWRLVSSAIDGQTVDYIVKHIEAFN